MLVKSPNSFSRKNALFQSIPLPYGMYIRPVFLLVQHASRTYLSGSLNHVP